MILMYITNKKQTGLILVKLTKQKVSVSKYIGFKLQVLYLRKEQMGKDAKGTLDTFLFFSWTSLWRRKACSYVQCCFECLEC